MLDMRTILSTLQTPDFIFPSLSGLLLPVQFSKQVFLLALQLSDYCLGTPALFFQLSGCLLQLLSFLCQIEVLDTLLLDLLKQLFLSFAISPFVV